MNRLRNLSIAWKISGVVLGVLLIMGLGNGIALFRLCAIKKELDGIVNSYIPLREAITLVATRQLEQSIYLEMIFLKRELPGAGTPVTDPFKSAKEAFIRKNLSFHEQLGKPIQLAQSNIEASSEEEGRETSRAIAMELKGIEEKHEVYRNHAGELFRLVEEHNLGTAKNSIASIEAEGNAIIEGLEKQGRRVQALTEGAILKATRYEEGAINHTVLISLSGGLLGLVFGLLVVRNISHPLAHLNAIARRISRGDLNVKINSDERRDEVGLLLETFRKMVRFLKEIALAADKISAKQLDFEIHPQSDKDILGKAMETMMENTRFAMGEIEKGTRALTEANAQISSSERRLSSASTQTAAVKRETVATLEEITQTTDAAREKANSVVNQTRETVKVSREGEQSVKRVKQGMQEIQTQMATIVDRIMHLYDQAQNLGKINETVTDFAEQSNILAINAAIEAAKADKQGEGFSVVAEEIRSLAEKSKQAAGSVKAILDEINKATETAISAVEEGNKVAVAGVEQAAETEKSIKSLVAYIKESELTAISISASTRQQSVGMEQLGLAMKEIEKSSAQNREATEMISGSVTSLLKIGKTLKGITEGYRL